MARRKSAVTKPSPSAATTSRAHKRQLSTTPNTATPGSRASKRLKGSDQSPAGARVTPTKSKYFEDPDSEDLGEDETQDEAEGSGYEDQDDASLATESVPSETDQDDYDSSEDDSKRKKAKPAARGGKAGGATGLKSAVNNALSKAKDLWRPGVSTGLGPGKQVFIAKPKPRGDGGIKYEPAKIHPNTMEFLKDLKKNNDREWLKMHDPDYRTSWKDWESFVESLTEKISEIDETIPELPPKDLVFRIYRDVRFSNDPTPYKPHFSAAWSRTGRKGPYACYYVQIQPGGKSLVGAGLWMPEAQPLALLRRNIDRKPHQLRQVLVEPQMRNQILGGISKDEKKAVKAFAGQNTENALKTKPKGYEADNPNIELLRLRNFTLGKRMTDDEITGARGLENIMQLIGVMVPFVTYLNSVVMPDDDDDDEEDDGDDGSSTSQAED